ncbi:chitin-binding protein, partial [Mycobacterium colombiense]
MKLKKLVGGVTIAGALSAAALGMGAGFANAAPGAPQPPGNHGGAAPG